jgi:hypothetical protein
MTAVILPFIRPSSRFAAPPLVNLKARPLNPWDYAEVRRWAERLGPAWSVDLALGGPDAALSIRSPRCALAAADDGEPASPWLLAWTEGGILVLEDGWLERGTCPTLAAALARVLEAEGWTAGAS